MWSKFELKHVNPHNLLDDDLGTNEQRLRELEHVLHVHPDGDRAQQGIIRLLIKEGRHEDALKSARRYLESRPENPNGYFLIGSVLEKLDRCDEAKEFLNDAFAVASHESHKSLHLQLGTCAYLTKDFDAAFEHFDKAINTYLDTVEPEHRFQFALSAVAVGEDETARTLLRHLVYAADPSDTTAISKAQALLSDL